MQTPSTETRASSFGVDEGVGTPASLKIFGGAFVILWLGMLGLVYVARRRQLALKSKLSSVETALARHG